MEPLYTFAIWLAYFTVAMGVVGLLMGLYLLIFRRDLFEKKK